MKKDLLHTPEGVRDIYGKECLEKRKIIGACVAILVLKI